MLGFLGHVYVPVVVFPDLFLKKMLLTTLLAVALLYLFSWLELIAWTFVGQFTHLPSNRCDPRGPGHHLSSKKHVSPS